MAFFLLMWLLGSTTEGDKKGIADYFQSPLKVALLATVARGRAIRLHVIKGGGQDLTALGRPGQARRCRGQAQHHQPAGAEGRAARGRGRQAAGAEASRWRDRSLKNNPKLAQFASQIKLDMTRDGLRIQIVDEPEPADVRQRQRGGQALHARTAARHRQRADRGAQPADAGRPHRRPALSAAARATATGSCRPTGPMPRGASWWPAA
jgi:hypothetical protein